MFILLVFAFGIILTVHGQPSGPNSLSCRGVLAYDNPVWPLDECISFTYGAEEQSQEFICESDTVRVRSYNQTGCPTEALRGVSDVNNITAHGCDTSVTCGMARVDEALNSSYTDTCTPNTDAQQVVAPVALDQCWWDNPQNAYVSISCKPDDTSSFGYTLTYTEYSDECHTETSQVMISEPGCLDTLVHAPYFRSLSCEWPSEPDALPCRGVIPRGGQPMWPLDECISFSDERGDTSQEFNCDGSTVRVRRYNASGCPSESFIDEEDMDIYAISGHGCDASVTCGMARVDELLNSSYTDTCEPNQDGTHIIAPVGLDQCWYNEEEQLYVELTCEHDESASFGYTITYHEYSDECMTETRSTSLSEPGCLDIPVSPYFNSLSCEWPSGPDALSCRGVLFTGGQPVWPLDECINYADERGETSQWFYCDDGSVRVRRYDGTGCTSETLSEDTYVDDEISAHGCYSYNTCAMARVDEYLNSSYTDTCTKNEDGTHIIAPVGLNQCWYNEEEQLFVEITCEEDDTASFGYTVTYHEYSDECMTETRSTSLSEAGCLDIPVSPYFVSLSCEEETEPDHLSCRGVTKENEPIWPLEECISFSGSHAGHGESQEFYCQWDQVRVRRYNGTGCSEDDFYEERFVDGVTAHGCDSRAPCGIARVNEWLNSSHTNTCVQNQDGMNVDAPIALDQCWFDAQQDAYVKVSCVEDTSATFGYTLTYSEYSDECQTETSSNTISEPGCLDIEVSPYFTALECVFPSPVYETECRSVSENNNIVWPLNECFGTASGDYASSSMYYCDDDNEVYKQKFDSFDCTGDSETEIPTNVNGHGCDRTKICETFDFDEYLNSSYTGSCVKDTNQVHVNGSIVLDTCMFQDDTYFKVTCAVNEQAAFGYSITYLRYTEAGCTGTAEYEAVIEDESCLNIEVAPYFVNGKCTLRSPVYETECRSVSENNNIVWPLDECVSMSAFKDGTREYSSFIYKCDENDELYKENYDGSADCDGDAEVVLPIGVNGHGCTRSKPCETMQFDEWVNSIDGDTCAKNEEGEHNMNIIGAIVLDTCILQDGEYFKVSCAETEATEFGYTVTYQNYTDAGCTGTAAYETSLGAMECLDVGGSPYFDEISCKFRTPVYEDSCRSVSQNNSVVWPLDYCIGQSHADPDTSEVGPDGARSWKFVCDENADGTYSVLQTVWKSMDCSGASISNKRVTDINGHGCDRTDVCDMAIFDEYLHSIDDSGCNKNEYGEDNHRIQGAVVLNTCAFQDGEYYKVGCIENGESGFGYKIVYTNYTNANCVDGDEAYETDLYAEGCLEIEASPYFASLDCVGAETTTTQPETTEIAMDTTQVEIIDTVVGGSKGCVVQINVFMCGFVLYIFAFLY